jgi:hypothetical protein
MKGFAMFNKEIKTVKDVRQYFSFMVNERKVNFHPDTDFSEYVSCETGKSTFTDEEIDQFNSLMGASFEVCELAEADIYEIGLEMLKGTMNAGKTSSANP